MDQWNGPFDQSGLHRHCGVAIDDHRVIVIGGATSSTLSTSMILDVNTGEWKNTAPNPNPRGSHACLGTTINGIFGVLVTGGSDFRTDPNDYYPGSQVDFYQIEMDSWITLANSSFPVYDHQLVLYGNFSVLGLLVLKHHGRRPKSTDFSVYKFIQARTS